MLKKFAMMLGACVAALGLSGSASAEHFDFVPGMGPDPRAPEMASGDGTPYSWYYQSIHLDFSDFPDGRQDTTGHPTANGNVPYFIFDGTDTSPAGHCLEISFMGPEADSLYPSNFLQDLRFTFTDSHDNDLGWILDATLPAFDPNNPIQTTYSGVARLWIQNTGTTLTWHTKIADFDGNNGSWNQSAVMNIWRLEMNQTTCTSTASNNGIPFITIIGKTGSYTVCDESGTCTSGS